MTAQQAGKPAHTKKLAPTKGQLAPAGLTIAVLFAASGCGLLPGDADPVADFEKIVAATGTGGVQQVDVAVLNDKLRVSVTTLDAAGPRTWSLSDGKVVSSASTQLLPGPPIPAAEVDIAALAAGLEALAGEDCVEPEVELNTTPGGARVSWQTCDFMVNPQYVPGSSTVDGEPVADRFDPTRADEMAALASLYGKVFAGGQLLAFTQNNAAPRFVDTSAVAPATELPDGTTCYPGLTIDRPESSADIASPLRLMCETDYRPGTVATMTAFTLADHDPALLAGVWQQAAAAGVPAEQVQYIGYTRTDDRPLTATVLTTSRRMLEIPIGQ